MNCPFCRQPMTRGANPSHYLSCVEVTSAFGPPPARPKTGNTTGSALAEPGYAKRARASEDPTTWTKICSIAGCGAPVKRTGYCALHQAEYMVGWRTGERRTRTKGRIHIKRVRPDADPEIA